MRSSTCRPRMPPAALISSTASFAPCTCSTPASACGPVTSSTKPNTIGSAARAGATKAAPSEQAAIKLISAIFICCSSIRFYGPAFGRLYSAPKLDPACRDPAFEHDPQHARMPLTHRGDFAAFVVATICHAAILPSVARSCSTISSRTLNCGSRENVQGGLDTFGNRFFGYLSWLGSLVSQGQTVAHYSTPGGSPVKQANAVASIAKENLLFIFGAFLKLGTTSFGGPIAHLGYLRAEFVERRKWLDDKAYADLVSLCQFLPGPASSQVGFALGISQRGLPGGIVAWLGFTLPSAIIMIAFEYGAQLLSGSSASGWLHGLKLAAVAIVAQAVWSVGRQLCPDRVRASFAIGAAVLVLVLPGALVQLSAIALGAVLGWRFLVRNEIPEVQPEFGGFRALSWIAWTVFIGLLVLLPIAARVTDSYPLSLFDSFYRAGSFVFGGGHVVLPLLHEEVVPRGWISDSDFLAGYGMAQVIPGPLFTFAAYIGAAANGQPNGWVGGLIALVGIFLPGFLLLLGALPYWDQWRRQPAIRAAMDGVNAVVVGILLAALYDPIFTSSVHVPRDLAVALVAFAMLVFWRLSPLWVVIFSAVAGMAAGSIP